MDNHSSATQLVSEAVSSHEADALNQSRAKIVNEESTQRSSLLLPNVPGVSRSPSSSSFRSQLLSILSRKHEKKHDKPTEAPKSKGPLGLNTLYDPPDGTALVEIIFVHGLGGGSQRTWTNSRIEGGFWPQSWLPDDPEFECARIHSFGYDADWRDRSLSVLSIQDFARNLLTEMRNHPSIRRTKTEIIMVGHSMGGCVAKKAYVLARQDPASESFASRFTAMFFLATPHRGSNLAKIIRNVLLFTGVSKPYLEDLSANSVMLVELNNAFQRYAQDLLLWSFFETRPVSERPEVIVVDKFSATLGYSHEEVLSMDADHRRICKYDSINDPNYKKVRNALSTAVDMVRIKAESSSISLRARLDKYLGVDDSYQDDLSLLQKTKLPGSCVWLTEQTAFKEWMTETPESLPILWLTGIPGAGKSIVSSHVTDLITHQGYNCSFYFFHGGQTGSAGLGPFLTYIAYQMALKDAAIREKVFWLQDNFVSWQVHDERSIWRKLFIEGIFQVAPETTHYWIIDGLDECSGSSNFLRLIPQIPNNIRIFVTSRNTPEIDRGLSSLSSLVQVYPISIKDTVSDMTSVIRVGLEPLPLNDVADLESKLLHKSSGSFIWVRLVLQELETAFTDDDVEDILNEVPDDLHRIYERILVSIETNKRRARVAKSILFFVALAIRPMTTEELRQAVQLHIGQTLLKIDQIITVACGQLVAIDQGGRVHMIHETARDFLISDGLKSALAVSRYKGHSYLACLCIAYMNSQLQKRFLGNNSAIRGKQNESAVFLNYASTAFSQHLLKSEPNITDPLDALSDFLDTNLLHWTEYIARECAINILSRTAMDISRYIDQGTQNLSFAETCKVKSWAMDLSRVALTFRDQLQKDPSTIHDIIPRLCPASTSIAARNADKLVPLKVLGLPNSWDDCFLHIETGMHLIDVVAYGETYFAVGKDGGQISIYDTTFLQHKVNVDHDDRLRDLAFGGGDKYLASLSSNYVIVWDPKAGTLVCAVLCDSPWTISFWQETLLVAQKDGDILICNPAICEIGPEDLPICESKLGRWLPSTPKVEVWPWGAHDPKDMVFSSSDLGLIAVTFYTKEVYVFDIHTPSLRGSCSGPTPGRPLNMAFNPNPQINALVVSYVLGSLVVFDLDTLAPTFVLLEIFAWAMACSPDGRFLIIGTQGTAHIIKIYEFKKDRHSVTLVPVYSTSYPHKTISDIATGGSGIRFASIHHTECRVWDPSLSLHRLAEASHFEPNVVDGKIAICGTEQGEVISFSTADGSELGMIYKDPDPDRVSAIALVEREGESLIVVAIREKYPPGYHMVMAQVDTSSTRWVSTGVLLKREGTGEITTILINSAKDRALIYSFTSTILLELPSGNLIGKRDVLKWKSAVRMAGLCPSDDGLFMIFEDGDVYLFNWGDFSPAKHHKLDIVREVPSPEWPNIQTTYHYQNQDLFVEVLTDVLDTTKLIGTQTGPSQLNCWDASQFCSAGDVVEISPRCGFQHLAKVLKTGLFLLESTLVFVDVNLWVCTLNLATFASTHMAKRHFFILPEWLNAVRLIEASVTPSQDLIFVNKQGLVVVKGWLATSQLVRLSPNSEAWEVVSKRQREVALPQHTASPEK
ncbi:Protein SERAC1-like protein [Cladobotryum mycophilum]|uniref:GPI inositol-deacylase n=1 Tax=Cladobotryum mycophilum TaxID=491253 RepID=A0ABR0SEQ2_9HYPO